jgi:rRNA maturation RNase YbeY
MASRSKSKVYFFFLNTSFSFRNRTSVKKFIETIFKKEHRPLGKISYIFCSDVDLLALNKKFLFHNYYTDILTFDLSENINEINAEIYISIERIKKNAVSMAISFKSELHRVMIHGVLHLCGYNDKSRSASKKMRAKEDYYLSTSSI